MAESHPVPPALTGVWRRERITAPGLDDATTQVFWVQARSWYGDIRAPAERPRARVTRVEDYGLDDLARLAAVEGFGGELSVTPELCRWRRDLDFQPPAASPDEGTWRLDGDVLVERGVHWDYEEIWVREPDSDGARLAFMPEDGKGLLVVAGDHFIAMRDRERPLPAAANLAELVARDGLAAAPALAMPIAYGRIADGWRVALSSEPWREGRPLGRLSFADGVLRVDGRRWRLMDSSVADVTGALKL